MGGVNGRHGRKGGGGIALSALSPFSSLVFDVPPAGVPDVFSIPTTRCRVISHPGHLHSGYSRALCISISAKAVLSCNIAICTERP